MLSIAAMCRLKGWTFHYTSKKISTVLENGPTGNYAEALRLGMQVHEVDPQEYTEAVGALRNAVEKDTGALFIPQGGADPSAAEGVAVMAEEIRAWMAEQGVRNMTVATPSGTGTTAAYLARCLPECRVVTVPVIGDTHYLKAQIERLMPTPENLTILSTRKRYRFGAPDPELHAMYLELKAAGIEFDLLYAPVMWKALLERECPDEVVMYVHSGGTGGNVSMLARYERYFGNSEKAEGKQRKRGRGAGAP